MGHSDVILSYDSSEELDRFGGGSDATSTQIGARGTIPE